MTQDILDYLQSHPDSTAKQITFAINGFVSEPEVQFIRRQLNSMKKYRLVQRTGGGRNADPYLWRAI